MIKEFKEFLLRGNVLDLAVAVIIGGAFGTIVTSFTADVLMPPIGMMLGGTEFDQLKMVLQPEVLGADGAVATPEVAIRWGMLVKHIIDFLIVAFVLFLIIKTYNATKKPVEAAPAGPSEVDLLSEIRDLLKKK
jgi:large conductance mechanosensitive channel